MFKHVLLLGIIALSMGCRDNAPLQSRGVIHQPTVSSAVKLSPDATLELYVTSLSESMNCEMLKHNRYVLPLNWLPTTSARADQQDATGLLYVSLETLKPSNIRMLFVRAIDFSTDTLYGVACVDNLFSLVDKKRQLHLYLEPVQDAH